METDTEKKLLEGLGTVQKSTETLIKNYDSLDKETKKSMEEFQKATKRLESVEEIQRSMQKMQMNLRREARGAWGCPARRIAQDEQMRTLVQLNVLRGLGLMDQVGTKTKERLEAFVRDLGEGSTPGSTYIANNELETQIYDLLATYGAFRQLDVRTIGAKTTEVRIKSARPLALFVDEAAAIGQDSTKAGSKAAVTPKKVGCLITASSELLQDDITGIVQDLMNDMAEAHAFRADWISFAATGTADNVDGGFTGMFAGGTARTATTGNTTVAALAYADVLACVVNAPTAVFQRGNAKWFINQNILAKLLFIKDGNGRPIFQSALEAPSYGALGTILGYPVIPVAAAPSTDSAGKLVAAFGDGDGQGVRIRRDVTFDRSEHYSFNTEEITFRSTSRIAAQTKLASAFQVLKTAAT